MKNFLLLFAFIYSISAVGQNNAPVAVDDSITFYYDKVNGFHPDTVGELFYYYKHFLHNDSDPDNDTISIDTAYILGSTNNFIELYPINQNQVQLVKYFVVSPFQGTDSIKYVVKDNGNPVKYDTATLYITVRAPLHAMLDANNINARVDIFSLFSKWSGVIGSGGNPGFEVPSGSGNHSIFSANLWASGKLNNTVYSSVKREGWHYTGRTSNSGPVSNGSSQYIESNPKWDMVWKVKQSDIDYHLAFWNTPNYTPPHVFLSWPAHGDISLGEAANLAPFIDHNNDGVYNPYAGDYPKIKGDQAIYFIYNDGGSFYSINPMKSEIHGMAYAFQCPDSAMQNTIFVDYKIINRSNNTYDSTYFGLWTEMDLGNSQDDCIQCDVDRSLFYTYNGDDFDNSGNGTPGYGNHPPAQACALLKGAKQDADGQDNAYGINSNQSINGSGFGDGISDNEYWGMEHFQYYTNGGPDYGDDPRFDNDYYNYMSGKWKDSSSVLFGASGHSSYSTTTSTPAKFMFPGTSDSFNYGTGGINMPSWTETTAGNSPGDRRGVSSSGPVTFAPGDEIELTYAFVFGRDYVNTSAQAGVTNMLERADSIRSYYDQGMLTACGFPVSVKESVDIESEIYVYPNPAKNTVNIRQANAAQIHIAILDVTGKVVLSANSSNQLTQIDISGLTNGIYFVTVQTKETQFTQKIIKQ